jgi:tetratricopeptide (TPR) repeat protein
MLFAFRPSLLSLALSLCLIGLLLTPVRSASGALNAAQTPAEAEVRAVVERYFVFYAAKDLDGLLALWSERSPEHSALKTDLQKQFAAEDYRLDRSEISRVKVGETKASLRATVNLTITNLKGDERREQQMARNFDLVREDGRWRIWRSAPAVNDLAEALAKLKIEGERSTLLIEEKELLTPDLVRALNDQGSRLRRQNNHPQALVLHRLAQSIGERIGDRRGVGTQALENYQKSLAIGEEIGEKRIIAAALNNIGRVHRGQGNYPQALEFYQRSLAISEAIGAKYGIALVLNNLGSVHSSQGNYAGALEHYQKSLKLREEIGDKVGVASTLNNIGRAHLSQGDYAQALPYLQKSLALREEIGNKGGIVDTLNNIGDVYEKQGRYAQVLETASRAAALARQMGDTELLWKARLLAGSAARALKDTAQARPAFEEAITIMEGLRANVAGGEREQQRFFESKVSPYHAMVGLLNSESRAAEALTFAERAKARVLLDVLQTGRVNVTKAMTAEEREQERQLNLRLVSLNTQILREANRRQPDQARLSDLKAQLEKARLEFSAFQTVIYAAHPELKTQRGEA